MVTEAMKLKDTCSLEEQPRQHIKKQRHYLPTKICLVKTLFFSVVMYGCESWTIKKAECQGIDALNCGVGEESLELQGDPTSPS